MEYKPCALSSLDNAFKLAGGYIETSISIDLLRSEEELLSLGEPSRDCRRPKTLRQCPYEKQTILN